jgi:hypothetical protein
MPKINQRKPTKKNNKPATNPNNHIELSKPEEFEGQKRKFSESEEKIIGDSNDAANQRGKFVKKNQVSENKPELEIVIQDSSLPDLDEAEPIDENMIMIRIREFKDELIKAEAHEKLFKSEGVDIIYAENIENEEKIKTTWNEKIESEDVKIAELKELQIQMRLIHQFNDFIEQQRTKSASVREDFKKYLSDTFAELEKTKMFNSKELEKLIKSEIANLNS